MPRKLLPLLLLLLLAVICACGRAGRILAPKDRGGTYLIIAVKAQGPQLDQAIAQTIDVINKRCKQLDIYCNLQRQTGGDGNRLRLRFSSEKDPERIKSILLSQGIELRAVVSEPSPAPLRTYVTEAEASAAAGADKDVLPYVAEGSGGGFLVVEREPIVTGHHIRNAKVSNQRGEDITYEIFFELNPEGAQRLGDWTGTHLENYMAIVFDKRVRSAPVVRSRVAEGVVLTGAFTEEQAEDAALVLMSGNLPAPIEALEEGFYSP